jgi:hypothetical protein
MDQSDGYIDQFLEENELSTQLVQKIQENYCKETWFPTWMAVIYMNLLSTTVPHYTSYTQFLVDKNNTPEIRVDAIILNNTEYVPGGFYHTPGLVTAADANDLSTRFYRFSKTNVDTKVVNVAEDFFF